MRIPYKGSGIALLAVITGEADLIFSPLALAMPHVKSGKLRALGITSAQPTPLVPGVPTVAASGLPGYELVSIDAIFAPAKTPVAMINRLNQEIVRVINRADVKEKFFNAGVDLVRSSPEDLANKTKSEIVLWTKVIKEAALQAD